MRIRKRRYRPILRGRAATIAFGVVAGECSQASAPGTALNTSGSGRWRTYEKDLHDRRSPPTTAGCFNERVTNAIRAALVQANGLPGGQTVPRRTYYGTCGSDGYAVARCPGHAQRDAPGAG